METKTWLLSKNSKGIEIYTRPHQASDYRAYKAQMLIEGSMSPFLAVFEDVSAYKNWMHTTIISELVEQPSSDVKHIYMVNRNFPIKDRDYYAELTTSRSKAGVYVKWNLLDMPTEDGRVRVKKLDVTISLEPKPDNSFLISLQGHFEPGGLVPAALANAFITDVPFNTFLKIRKMAKLHSSQGHNSSAAPQ